VLTVKITVFGYQTPCSLLDCYKRSSKTAATSQKKVIFKISIYLKCDGLETPVVASMPPRAAAQVSLLKYRLFKSGKGEVGVVLLLREVPRHEAWSVGQCV
jgi:hypothetical protein